MCYSYCSIFQLTPILNTTGAVFFFLNHMTTHHAHWYILSLCKPAFIYCYMLPSAGHLRPCPEKGTN